MKKRIVFVSHCMLNSFSKVKNESKLRSEEYIKNKNKFLAYLIEEEIGIIQLPCPEFTLYGLKRWGHVKDQFDTPFFRNHCRRILMPFIDEMEEYLKQYDVIGIIGIDGSPSCGVNKTCIGNWGGELSNNDKLQSVIESIKEDNTSGIFIEEFKKLLNERNINVPFEGYLPSSIENLYKFCTRIEAEN